MSNRVHGAAVRPNQRALTRQCRQQRSKAEAYLELFSPFAGGYEAREKNPYLNWMKTNPRLEPEAMYKFLNRWYPVSRHQPQMLLRIAAAYPEWRDRSFVMANFTEEDGRAKVGDDPHYFLLERLIVKLGGKLDIDQEAEELVNQFHRSLDRMTAAEATGYVAAIEHPALDISDYFQHIARLCGRTDLARTDPYLYIHTEVEPRHIIWSHGNALDWIEDEERQRKEGYTRAEIIGAYQSGMVFWTKFWQLAFEKLGYHQ
jgi:hypothetical protein